MSEYQYYEWQTIDRILTPEEQAAVDGLSSHIDVTTSGAMVEYHWSDFKHDPKQVLMKLPSKLIVCPIIFPLRQAEISRCWILNSTMKRDWVG